MMVRTVSEEELFDVGAAEGLISELMRKCFEDQAVLTMRIVNGGAKINVSQPELAQPQTSLTLGGLPKTMETFSNATIGTKIMMPFLGEIMDVSLPYSQIYAVRYQGRSVADLFMRNLALSLCRFEPLSLNITMETNPSPIHLKLLKRYLWIVRSFLDDDVFSSDCLVDKLQIDSHFKILSFQSAILRGGMMDLRRHNAEQPLLRGSAAEDMKNEFLQARGLMMQHFQA